LLAFDVQGSIDDRADQLEQDIHSSVGDLDQQFVWQGTICLAVIV
jgi:hypothetical protein